jgi:integrase
MPTNRLTDAELRATKKKPTPFKTSDGGGLYVLVQPSGTRLWRVAYRFQGKQKTLALGSYPTVSLAKAREGRDAAKNLLRVGVDPGEARKTGRDATEPTQEHTFAAVAERWFAARRSGWVPGYASRVWSRVKDDLIKEFGATSIGAIDTPCILSALRKIEGRGALEMARRVKEYADDIFRYARAEKLLSTNPVEGLAHALAAPPPKKHRAALKARDIPTFLDALESYDGEELTKRAVQLALLTFVRTSELRFARWEEFEDLDGPEPLWRIPGPRMKMRNDHLVPLSRQALDIVQHLPRLVGAQDLLFSARTKCGAISENTMIYALYRMGYHGRATVHGFRGTASTVLNENGFNRDWIERQLAHVERDQVRAAYNAAEWLSERRVMMQWWADWLSDQAQGRPTARPTSAASRLLASA